jgi:hypothetical protein
MAQKVRSVSRAVLHSILGAIRARPKVFVAITVAVVVINLVLPPIVLSVARKPWDHFSVNPWLHNIPRWLASDRAPIGDKIAFLTNMAILWFLADSPYDAPEWGFTATVSDIGRWMLMGMLFGVYFALWVQVKPRLVPGATILGRWRGRGGAAGTVLTTLGFSTMPCSVAGCGAPVLPVVGLALTGLSSGALAAISLGSRVFISVLLFGVAANVIYLAYAIGAAAPASPSTRS